MLHRHGTLDGFDVNSFRTCSDCKIWLHTQSNMAEHRKDHCAGLFKKGSRIEKQNPDDLRQQLKVALETDAVGKKLLKIQPRFQSGLKWIMYVSLFSTGIGNVVVDAIHNLSNVLNSLYI